MCHLLLGTSVFFAYMVKEEMGLELGTPNKIDDSWLGQATK